MVNGTTSSDRNRSPNKISGPYRSPGAWAAALIRRCASVRDATAAPSGAYLKQIMLLATCAPGHEVPGPMVPAMERKSVESTSASDAAAIGSA